MILKSATINPLAPRASVVEVSYFIMMYIYLLVYIYCIIRN